MKKIITTALCCISILLALKLSAQELPLGTQPIKYNGGFAGETGNLRMNFGSGLTTSSITLNNVNAITVDGFIPKIRTGVGVSTGYGHSKHNFNAIQINGALAENEMNDKVTFITFAISPKLSFRGKYTFAPFFDYSYTNFNSNTKWGFLDSVETFRNNTSSWSAKGRAGFLFNTRKLYVGITFDIFNASKRFGNRYSIFTTNDFTTSYFLLGYSFQKSLESKFSVTPQLVLGFRKFPGSKPEILLEDFSLMFKYKKVIWGLNNSGVAIGFQSRKYKILLSQFYNSGYYGSLTLRYIFKNNSKSLLNY
ncbi:MAG TPA: hypothetical protein VD908_19385 [Cytophagales bacterium]|nr:hypothetical protein [Cytophagales bacterium]